MTLIGRKSADYMTDVANQPRDRRAWTLLILALVPIVGTVAGSIVFWVDEERSITQIQAQTDPIRLQYQVHGVSASLSTSLISLSAAADPGAGPEILARAVVDRDAALAQLDDASPTDGPAGDRHRERPWR